MTIPMDTIEVTANTIEEAREVAAKQLGVQASEVEINVIEEVKGLFGRGSIRAQATIKAAPAEKPKRSSRAKKSSELAPAESPIESDARDQAEEIRESADSSAVEIIATQEDADRLMGLVNDVLRLANLDAKVHPTEVAGKYVNLEIDGKDVAYLVGRQGEVLNAFQYLINVMAAKQIGNGVRVVLDGGNYRKRREEALRKMASQIAEQVKARGEEAVLDALPAFERRVVHQAIVEIPGVTTYSEGEEPNRRVVIAPGA